jgi:hypothetical protein
VTSIVSDPNADPHEYESSTIDARAIADAKFVIVNGAGYDVWALHLISASNTPNQTVLNVANLLGKKEGENTLDYWAGYSPNPDDSLRLREKLKELKGSAPLLKPVGSFGGQGQTDEQPLFDLGGNVAEWVLTSGGIGKPVGGSADCPADPKSNCTPAREYVGFRVVRGEAKTATGQSGAGATPVNTH